MRIITMFFYLLIGAALAIFIYSNYEQSVVVYFTRSLRTVEIPLSLALFVSMLLGFLAAVTLAIVDQFRLRTRLRRLRKANERLESELEALRNLPLTSPAPSKSEADDNKALDEPPES